MCLNHKTVYSCGHATIDVTICLASIAPIIHRATTFPYVQVIPAVAVAKHEVVTTLSKTGKPCQACVVPVSVSSTQPNTSSFLEHAGAANRQSGDALIYAPGLTLNLESDKEWDSTLRELVTGREGDNTNAPTYPSAEGGSDHITDSPILEDSGTVTSYQLAQASLRTSPAPIHPASNFPTRDEDECAQPPREPKKAKFGKRSNVTARDTCNGHHKCLESMLTASHSTLVGTGLLNGRPKL